MTQIQNKIKPILIKTYSNTFSTPSPIQYDLDNFKNSDLIYSVIILEINTCLTTVILPNNKYYQASTISLLVRMLNILRVKAIKSILEFALRSI